MSDTRKPFLDLLLIELVTFLVLLFVGVLFVPMAIYLVGSQIFGDYAGSGFVGFFGDIHSNLRSGNSVALFLVLSPYIVWQLLRLSALLFRMMAPKQ